MRDDRLPPLNALRAFEAVARLGSQVRAGDALHVTHGAISRQIRSLEASLGTPLFVRSGRGLRLTPAGENLQAAAGDAFERLRGAVSAIRRRGTEERGFVLGCPGTLLARWMIPRLPALSAALPQLKPLLSPHENAFPASLAGFDAALLIGEPPWPASWRVRRLAPERIGPVFGARHPDVARLRSLDADALLREPLLHTASRPQAWSAWARVVGSSVPPTAGAGFEHLYFLLEAAAAGLGVAIAPQQLVADDLAAGRLLAPWGFVETDAVWALVSLAGAADARIDAFADWLRAALDPADT